MENKKPELVQNPHALTIDDLFQRYNVDKKGLSSESIAERIQIFGKNEIPDPEQKKWWNILFNQFKSLLVFILILAALFSWFTGHLIDTYVIIGVILINSIIGFVQEMKAEQAVASLKRMAAPRSKVLRDDRILDIPSSEIVPGDMVILEEGDQIPADARLFYCKNLRVTEAALTGESVPVEKNTEPVPEKTPVADQKNMVRKGTFIAGGYAKALVTATGLETALGKIALSLTGIEKKRTHFQQKTDKLAKQMAEIAIFSAIALYGIGRFAREMDYDELLLVAIAAMVSSIPEGLPAVLSIVLAIGAHRMSNRNAIIREFTATETLGAVTTIITDKTGTLTQNTLTVRKLYLPSGVTYDITGEGWSPEGEFFQDNQTVPADQLPRDVRQLLLIAALSNNSSIYKNSETGDYQFTGDPTEAGLMALASKGGFSPSDLNGYEKLDDMPFSSDVKMRATIVDFHNKHPKKFVIGAPEQILERCSRWMDEKGEIHKLNEKKYHHYQSVIENMSEQAFRVIGFAFDTAGENESAGDENIEDLVLTGFTGMMDPPREDVPEAVAQCKEAGIRVVMATGDHKKTALAIAKMVGITDSMDSAAVTEAELLEMSEKEFEETVKSANIFARLTPDMKLKIAGVLQDSGELVAMTGDGVNDAPALKKADVGVSMGIMGTDVARDASKMILADDNFSTIVNAVEEGRIVFTNARQTSFFLLTTNFAEVTTLITAISVGMPLPLTATQILWLNLVTDGICDVSLATEQGHGDELQQKPIKRTENILTMKIIPFLIINAVVMTLMALLAFHWFLPESTEKARTSAFIVMAFCQIFNVYNMRSLRHSIFKIGFFSNKFINIGVSLSFIIQVLIIEIPFFELLFSFAPINPFEFISMIVMASSVLWFGELYKRYIGIQSTQFHRKVTPNRG